MTIIIIFSIQNSLDMEQFTNNILQSTQQYLQLYNIQ